MSYDQETIKKISDEVMKRIQTFESEPLVPIGISNRHIHLCQEDLEMLFGKDYQLTKMKELKQPGQFAAKETVTLVGPKGEITDVRILGPLRSKSQVEISITDSFKLGVSATTRESGNIAGTTGITIRGSKGTLKLEEGLIVAHRHIHVPPQFADKFQLKDKGRAKVEMAGERKTIYDNVLIRISDRYALEMHLDTDEANACDVKNGDLGRIISTNNSSSLSLDLLYKMVKVAEEKAIAMKVPIVFSVVDAGGNIILLHRMEGSLLASLDISPNKAYTAVAFKMATHELGPLVQPGKELYGAQFSNQGKIVPFGGGYPLKRDNQIIGGIGISGGSVKEDMEIAIEAMNIFRSRNSEEIHEVQSK